MKSNKSLKIILIILGVSFLLTVGIVSFVSNLQRHYNSISPDGNFEYVVYRIGAWKYAPGFACLYNRNNGNLMQFVYVDNTEYVERPEWNLHTKHKNIYIKLLAEWPLPNLPIKSGYEKKYLIDRLMQSIWIGSHADVVMAIKKLSDKGFNLKGLNTLYSAGNDLELTKILVQHGADVNEVNSSEHAPLHGYALTPEVAQYLINQGAELNAQNDNKKTPLVYHLYHRKWKLAELLIKNGADVHMEAINEDDAIDLVIRANKSGLVDKAKDEVDINALHYKGNTWLHHVMNDEELYRAKFFVEKGLRIDAFNDWGQTPLYLATKHLNKDMVEYLLSQGADPYAQDELERSQTSHDFVKSLADNEYEDEYKRALAKNLLVLFEKSSTQNDSIDKKRNPTRPMEKTGEEYRKQGISKAKTLISKLEKSCRANVKSDSLKPYFAKTNSEADFSYVCNYLKKYPATQIERQYELRSQHGEPLLIMAHFYYYYKLSKTETAEIYLGLILEGHGDQLKIKEVIYAG